MKRRPVFLWLLSAVLVMNWFGSLNALAWPMPDTGQTKCYNNTEEIPCPAPGEDFYGQDGSYTINPMSYSKLDASGKRLPDDAPSWTMVRDNVTGLIWEKKQNRDNVQDYSNPHDVDNTYTWYDSNPATNGGFAGVPGNGTDTEDFINALNAANYGGHNDWRLPTFKELDSIVNYGKVYPEASINEIFFSNTARSSYWSSTTFARITSYAWTVDFYSGGDRAESKGDDFQVKCYVRAVRGAKTGSPDRFVSNGDETVTDTETGLMWQQSEVEPGMTWEQALSYCENLNLAGHEDWRLPTVKELHSLVDYSRFGPAINPTYFPDISICYRSSTTFGGDRDGGYLWLREFYDGGDYIEYKDYNYEVRFRAVRGGQSRPLVYWVIVAPQKDSIWEIGGTMPIRWEPDGLEANIKISLSRQGGMDGSFETIIETTPNDGEYDWTITGGPSENCVIKMEQADHSANWAVEGPFVIKDTSNHDDDDGGCFIRTGKKGCQWRW
jgi:hypothetical protein